ncbi:MAG: hypothetical protein CMM01_19535 [Rhodopirellula sp.]|nr:hypothetical protein [Rhodopirellula sp.]
MEEFADYGLFAVFPEECCSSASARGVFRPTGIKSSGMEWLASANHTRPRLSVPNPRGPPQPGEQAKFRGNETAKDFDWFPLAWIPEVVVARDIPPPR